MKNYSRVGGMVICGLLAAMCAVLAFIHIPLPGGIPVTLQTFGMALCGYIGGPVRGTASVAVYITLGAVGLPVFAGFQGGVGVLFGPTGGFLWGFLIMALLCGLACRKKPGGRLILGFFGIAACHIIGILQYSLVTGNGLIAAFLSASLPYIIKDVITVTAAALITDRIGTKQ